MADQDPAVLPEETATRLRTIYAAMAPGRVPAERHAELTAGREDFRRAVAALRAAGWPYRVIGAACGVTAEAIYTQAKQATRGPTTLAPIPEAPGQPARPPRRAGGGGIRQRVLREPAPGPSPLPPATVEALRALWLRDVDDFQRAVRALRDAGWTLGVVAQVMGVSSERVRQHAASATPGPTSLAPVPAAPVKPTKPKPEPRVVPEVPQEVRERLREQYALARRSGLRSPTDREVSEAFSRELQALAAGGVPVVELARVLGAVPASLHHRLTRHGCRPTCNPG